MFKYFFSCSKSEIVDNGKLVLDRLGEAAVALRDCRLDTAQVTVQDLNAASDLGCGAVITPHPGDGSRVEIMGAPKGWKWLAFDAGEYQRQRGVQGLIGFDPLVNFAPDLLRRRRMIGGADIRDPDDLQRQWHVPIARSPAMAYGNLSTRWAPQTGGGMHRVLDKVDKWLWELSGEVHDYLVWNRVADGERPQWNHPWPIDRVVEILGVNYRIGHPELLALTELAANPLSDGFCHACLHSLVGFAEWDAWMAEQQKKTAEVTSPAPEDSKSGSGAPEDASEDSAEVNSKP